MRLLRRALGRIGGPLCPCEDYIPGPEASHRGMRFKCPECGMGWVCTDHDPPQYPGDLALYAWKPA